MYRTTRSSVFKPKWQSIIIHHIHAARSTSKLSTSVREKVTRVLSGREISRGVRKKV